MLFDFFDDLNWLAVIVSALAYFVLGWIWYSNFLFGKQYRAATGQEDDATPDPVAIVVNLVAWFVIAVALGLIAKAIGAESWVDGLVLGLTVAIGFVLSSALVGQFYEKRPMTLFWLNGTYTLLGFAIMGIILTLWT